MGATNKERLQQMSPAFSDTSGIELAQKIDDLMALVNNIKAQHNATDTAANGGSAQVTLADVTIPK